MALQWLATDTLYFHLHVPVQHLDKNERCFCHMHLFSGAAQYQIQVRLAWPVENIMEKKSTLAVDGTAPELP